MNNSNKKKKNIQNREKNNINQDDNNVNINNEDNGNEGDNNNFPSPSLIIEFIFAGLVIFAAVNLFNNIAYDYFELNPKSIKTSLFLLILVLVLLVAYIYFADDHSFFKTVLNDF